MKLIPSFYQELDHIIRVIANSNAKCLCFFAPDEQAGVSTLTLSVANRLVQSQRKVLVLDLNHRHPISTELPPTSISHGPWQFDTISTQLSTFEHEGVAFLSVAELSSATSARDKQAVHDAFTRWVEEYEHILVDLSPLSQVNQSNIPSHVFASVATITFLVVSAGRTSEEALVQANEKLAQEGFANIHVVLSQFAQPPLGPILIARVNHCGFLPEWVKAKVCTLIQSHCWLFRPIGV